jgi:hypothetical protein
VTFLVFSLSALIWFAVGFGFKYYFDVHVDRVKAALAAINDMNVDEDTSGDQLNQLVAEIINTMITLLEEAESLEPTGDIYNYKINAKIINKLDELYEKLYALQ